MKTAGLMGGLQLAGEGVGVRRVFHLQLYQPLNRLLPAYTSDVFIGLIDQASHNVGDGYASLLDKLLQPTPTLCVKPYVQTWHAVLPVRILVYGD
jgi:hypothetical protein